MENQSGGEPGEIVKPQEEWVDLNEEIVQYLTQNSPDTNYEATKDAVQFSNTSEARVTQVLTSLGFAQMEIGIIDLKQTGNGDSRVGNHFFTDETGNFYIVFNKLKGLSNGEYVRGRNQLIEKTNKVLTVFEKPQLPPYTK